MLNGGDNSQAPVPHAYKLGRKAHDVLPYRFFLAADVDSFSPFFSVCVRFLRAVLVRNTQSFSVLSLFFWLEYMRSEICSKDPFRSFESVFIDVVSPYLNRFPDEAGLNPMKSRVLEDIHNTTRTQCEVFRGEFWDALSRAESQSQAVWLHSA